MQGISEAAFSLANFLGPILGSHVAGQGSRLLVVPNMSRDDVTWFSCKCRMYMQEIVLTCISMERVPVWFNFKKIYVQFRYVEI